MNKQMAGSSVRALILMLAGALLKDYLPEEKLQAVVKFFSDTDWSPLLGCLGTVSALGWSFLSQRTWGQKVLHALGMIAPRNPSDPGYLKVVDDSFKEAQKEAKLEAQ